MPSSAVDDDFVEYDYLDGFVDLAGDVVDPYPDLAQARREHPVDKVDMRKLMGLADDAALPAGPDMYTVFSHEYVQEVLHDANRFCSAGYAQVMGALMGHTILEMDAPEHIRHRNLVARAFRQKMLERWSDELINKTIHELIDQFAGVSGERGSAELVRGLTFPFPVKVISRILGLPDSDWPKFSRWSVELISVASNYERAFAASAALKDYFEGVVEQKRRDPQDDLISELVIAEVDGHTLSNEEIYAFLRLLLPAGAETTYRSSGNLLFGLLTHPEYLEAVRADRSLLPQTIEEALRWEPPLLFIMRTAVQDVELGGVQIPAGSSLGISLGAANRDENRYPDPDRFDIYRDPAQHMSFGFGPHMCLGIHLARLETRLVVNAVLDRLPDLRLDPVEMASEDPPHIHGMTFRSPTRLPVLFG